MYPDDPNFPAWTMNKIKNLVQGYKLSDMEQNDWLFTLKAEAAIIYFHSPYPEVRSVTEPFDDPETPVETLRAYFLGLIFMGGLTSLSTFFHPRQPAISIPSNVLQLLLAPCGSLLAKVLPDWSFRVRGRTVRLNPGPWSLKEQILATIMFTIASGPGSVYDVYLVQKLPQYLGQDWVTFGYEVVLALSSKFLGFGFAGVVRRFVVYPIDSIFPSVLPTLAVARSLVLPEPKREAANGWTITRYRFFLLTFAAMFLWVLGAEYAVPGSPLVQLDHLDCS